METIPVQADSFIITTLHKFKLPFLIAELSIIVFAGFRSRCAFLTMVFNANAFPTGHDVDLGPVRIADFQLIAHAFALARNTNFLQAKAVKAFFVSSTLFVAHTLDTHTLFLITKWGDLGTLRFTGRELDVILDVDGLVLRRSIIPTSGQSDGQ